MGTVDRLVRTIIGALLSGLASVKALPGGWAAAAIVVAILLFAEAAAGY